MALPTTITGISTAVACVGPFKSSGGNFYFIGRDSGDSTQIQCQKATDPTSSFSAVGTDQSPGVTVAALAAYQVSDVIHVVSGADGGLGNARFDYYTFNMASDAWVLNENVFAALDTRTSGGTAQFGCSVVVRSGGEVVLFYNGPRVANMGNSYSQTYYARRASGTWPGSGTQVSAGGTVDVVGPKIALGTSDAVHLLWHDSGVGNERHRTLTSGNSLQTASVIASTFATTNESGSVVSYDSSGTFKIVYTRSKSQVGSGVIGSIFFDSGNTPTLTASTGNVTNPDFPRRVYVDTGDSNKVWILYTKGTDLDLRVINSTDHGSSFANDALAFTATVNQNDVNLSVDGSIYQRGNDFVIPYVVNDNGTLKYNEYVVRTVVSDTLFAQSVM